MKNERNAGRKPHGKEAKKHKSIKLEQCYIDGVYSQPDCDSFSGWVEDLIKKELKKRQRKAA